MPYFKIDIIVSTLAVVGTRFTLSTYAAVNGEDWTLTGEYEFLSYEGACAAGLRYLETGKVR